MWLRRFQALVEQWPPWHLRTSATSRSWAGEMLGCFWDASVCLFVPLYIYIYIDIHTHTHTYIHVCMCVCVCVWVCACVRVRVCVCAECYLGPGRHRGVRTTSPATKASTPKRLHGPTHPYTLKLLRSCRSRLILKPRRHQKTGRGEVSAAESFRSRGSGGRRPPARGHGRALSANCKKVPEQSLRGRRLC